MFRLRQPVVLAPSGVGNLRPVPTANPCQAVNAYPGLVEIKVAFPACNTKQVARLHPSAGCRRIRCFCTISAAFAGCLTLATGARLRAHEINVVPCRRLYQGTPWLTSMAGFSSSETAVGKRFFCLLSRFMEFIALTPA